MSRDVRIKANFPTKLDAGDTGEVKAIISSANSDPSLVFDTAYIHTDSTIYPIYVSDSAVLYNTGTANGMKLDSDELFGFGAEIGKDKDKIGDIPGQDEGYIIFKIHIDQPAWYTQSLVSVDGENWDQGITVHLGDVIHFRLNYKNTGTIWQNSVTVHDDLCEGLELIKGTTTVNNETAANQAVSDSITDTGINIGDYKQGQWAVVEYDAKVTADAGEVIYNNAWIVTVNGTQYEKCKITVE